MEKKLKKEKISQIVDFVSDYYCEIIYFDKPFAKLFYKKQIKSKCGRSRIRMLLNYGLNSKLTSDDKKKKIENILFSMNEIFPDEN